MHTVTLPQPVFKGKGTFTPPHLTPEDLEQIRSRAERVEDQQIKTDLYRLIRAVERLS